jgi:hypothetical protein
VNLEITKYDIESMQEFSEYRLLMIEEAELILSNKKDYIQQNFLTDEAKIMRISDLVDFFILEEEPLIVGDLTTMGDIIRLKKFISSGSTRDYLYH